MIDEFYPYWYVLDGGKCCLIWCSRTEEGKDGDSDHIVTDEQGCIPVFRSIDELERYATQRGIVLEHGDNVAGYDSTAGFCNFEVVQQWLKKPNFTGMDCDAFLAVWNLLGDVSRAVNGNFEPDRERTKTIYSKLFWGNNLPTMTPVGRHYTPIWSRRELRIMREVLGDGLQMFRAKVKLQATVVQ